MFVSSDIALIDDIEEDICYWLADEDIVLEMPTPDAIISPAVSGPATPESELSQGLRLFSLDSNGQRADADANLTTDRAAALCQLHNPLQDPIKYGISEPGGWTGSLELEQDRQQGPLLAERGVMDQAQSYWGPTGVCQAKG